MPSPPTVLQPSPPHTSRKSCGDKFFDKHTIEHVPPPSQFGDNYLPGWSEFLKNYKRPPFLNADGMLVHDPPCPRGARFHILFLFV